MGLVDAITPEADGFVCLIGDFLENFVHQKRHMIFRFDRASGNVLEDSVSSSKLANPVFLSIAKAGK